MFYYDVSSLQFVSSNTELCFLSFKEKFLFVSLLNNSLVHVLVLLGFVI